MTLSPEALEAAAQRAIEWNPKRDGYCKYTWYANDKEPDNFDVDRVPVVAEYG